MNLLRQYFLSYRSVGMQTALILAGLFFSTGLAYGGDRGATVIGHHIRLEGYGLKHASQKIFELQVEQCAKQGYTVAPMPAGESHGFMSRDVYFVPGAVTTYEVIKGFQLEVDPPCKLTITKFENAVIDVPSGNCFIKFETRAASGNCKIAVSELSERKNRHRYLGQDRPTGEFKTIAGHKCSVYTGESPGFIGNVCYASKDTFDGLADGFRGARGPILSIESFTKNDRTTPVISLSAVKVESSIPIPVSILLPHLGDNFIIKGNR